MKNSMSKSVLVKSSTISLILALAVTPLFMPPRAAFAHLEVNNTAENIDPVDVQKFTASPNIKPIELHREGTYTVVDVAAERRQAALASAEAQASFLIPTRSSTALHDKNDGTVIYPLTVWYFEPGSSGFEIPSRPAHHGVDFPISSGTEINSIADGTVITNSYAGDGYGNYVEIEHYIGGQRVVSTYGHMVEPSTLVVGEQVRKGEVIGHIGSTGRSTGPHLHLEIRVNGNLEDPAAWLELNALR